MKNVLFSKGFCSHLCTVTKKLCFLSINFKNRVMRVLIIEDESRVANRLEKMLVKTIQDVQILDKLESVEEAIEFLSSDQEPDIIFSDIQLADGLCFDIYSEVDVQCPIIFTTAFNQYAIEAFKTNGLAYLLKPITEEDLRGALEKVELLTASESNSSIQSLLQTLQADNKVYKERFMVKVGEKIYSIPTGDIHLFYSFDKCNFLMTKEGRRYIVDLPLGALIEQLNPARFFQINRKFILSIAACKEILVYSNSRLRVNAKFIDKDPVIVARGKVGEFKKWLDR